MITEVIEKTSSNVVRVDVNVGGQWGNGTGLLIDQYGTILTCDHVVNPGGLKPQDILVVKQDELPKKAEILDFDQYHDLAIIKSKDLKNDGIFTRINYDEVKVGQDCFVLGYPLGLSHLTLAKAVISISAKGKGIVGNLPFETIQIDARVNGGNSGGPVYTEKGEVIGIVTMKYMPFFEQINELHSFVNTIPTISGMDMSFGDFSVTNFINYVNEGIRRVTHALDIVQVGIGWVIPIHFLSNLAV